MISARKRQQMTISPPPSWQSHASGSLMLFGEHAVLEGYPAIACAIDHWLHVSWSIIDATEQEQADQLQIISSLATHTTSWSELAPHPKLSFILAGLRWLKEHLSDYPLVQLPALRIQITSEINSTQGLGSSSAVMAALLVGFAPLLPHSLSLTETFLIGRELIRQVQGSGSGTDLAAALSGGVMLLTPLIGEIQRLAEDLPLTSVYVGYKTPTPEVIRQVQTYWYDFPDLYQQQLLTIAQQIKPAAQAIQQKDYPRLGRIMNSAHGLMHGLGVSDIQLDKLAHQLRQSEGIFGAKISGSGLGDCVIALGHTSEPFEQQITIQVNPRGAFISY